MTPRVYAAAMLARARADADQAIAYGWMVERFARTDRRKALAPLRSFLTSASSEDDGSVERAEHAQADLEALKVMQMLQRMQMRGASVIVERIGDDGSD